MRLPGVLSTEQPIMSAKMIVELRYPDSGTSLHSYKSNFLTNYRLRYYRTVEEGGGAFSLIRLSRLPLALSVGFLWDLQRK
jgi:hypothetical protein